MGEGIFLPSFIFLTFFVRSVPSHFPIPFILTLPLDNVEEGKVSAHTTPRSKPQRPSALILDPLDHALVQPSSSHLPSTAASSPTSSPVTRSSQRGHISPSMSTTSSSSSTLSSNPPSPFTMIPPPPKSSLFSPIALDPEDEEGMEDGAEGKRNIISDPEQHRKWKSAISVVISQISNHRCASIFATPIRERQAPGYREVVRVPMDLKTVTRRIRTEVSTTTNQVHRDLLLMFRNALMYNAPDTDVAQMALDFQADVEVEMARFRESDKSTMTFSSRGTEEEEEEERYERGGSGSHSGSRKVMKVED